MYQLPTPCTAVQCIFKNVIFDRCQFASWTLKNQLCKIVFAGPVGMAQSISDISTFQTVTQLKLCLHGHLLLFWLLYKCISTQHFASSSGMCFPSRHVSVSCTSQLCYLLFYPSYSLVLTSLTHLCMCPDWYRAISLLVATGQDEDKRSWRVQRVPVGDKVVQWVLQMGGKGTDTPPCTAVTFNQPVLNCWLGPKMGQRSIFGKP